MGRTAMQEVYDKFNSPNVTLRELFEYLYDNQKDLLAKEREQIVDAYNAGYWIGESDTYISGMNDGQQYYSSKYEQK